MHGLYHPPCTGWQATSSSLIVSNASFAVLSVVQKEKEQFIYLRPLTINNRREHLKRWIIVMAFIIIHHGELDMQQRI